MSARIHTAPSSRSRCARPFTPSQCPHRPFLATTQVLPAPFLTHFTAPLVTFRLRLADLLLAISADASGRPGGEEHKASLELFLFKNKKLPPSKIEIPSFHCANLDSKLLGVISKGLGAEVVLHVMQNKDGPPAHTDAWLQGAKDPLSPEDTPDTRWGALPRNKQSRRLQSPSVTSPSRPKGEAWLIIPFSRKGDPAILSCQGGAPASFPMSAALPSPKARDHTQTRAGTEAAMTTTHAACQQKREGNHACAEVTPAISPKTSRC